MAVRVERRREPTAFATDVAAVVRNLDYVLLAAVAGLVAFVLLARRLLPETWEIASRLVRPGA